ncbi:MAG: SdiA-regulated domain-containing protein [Chlorobi bacterium]|nr:SdiA-regulated domain-containing protein [Chlorobiota bacterium]MCI0715948.1 SdiA-regulated domain-containing protein [Chlorobiota bacterium]
MFIFSCGAKKDEVKNNSKNKEKSTAETKKTGSSSVTSALDWYDILSEDPKVIELPADLTEISGITFTNDNRLFAVGDEDADIFEIDYNSGSVIKRFSLGSMLVIEGDFEDISFARDKFYLLESKGKLYEFSEGSNGSFVDYKTYKTSLTSKYDVEGLCYDSETNSLLLACKGFGGDGLGKDKAVYSFSLNNMTFDDKPRFVIPQKEIKNNTTEGKFNPSGIARQPETGTFFIIAARGNTIVEISKDGSILNQKDLLEKVHKQAEGIAFKSDGTLFISNEGRGKKPKIVIYDMLKH